MRFFLDESLGLRIIRYLQAGGHDVTAGARDYRRGMRDLDALAAARRERRVFVSNDKDFVRLVVDRQLRHAGVIVFRLGNVSAEEQVNKLRQALAILGDDFSDLAVIYPDRVVVSRQPVH